MTLGFLFSTAVLILGFIWICNTDFSKPKGALPSKEFEKGNRIKRSKIRA